MVVSNPTCRIKMLTGVDARMIRAARGRRYTALTPFLVACIVADMTSAAAQSA